MNNKIFGYVRISSKEQNVSRQMTALIEYGINERDIFIDKQSGKDFNREQYQLLKMSLRENDLLVIKSIDRLGRNYNMVINEWKEITKDIKADIKVLDMPILDTRNNKELLGNVISDIVLSLLSYVAEQERDFIRQRQKEGIDNAIRKGRRFGRPRINIPHNFYEVVNRRNNGAISTKEAIKELNLKPNTFYNLLKTAKL